jgi:hypothetical protein
LSQAFLDPLGVKEGLPPLGRVALHPLEPSRAIPQRWPARGGVAGGRSAGDVEILGREHGNKRVAGGLVRGPAAGRWDGGTAGRALVLRRCAI